MHPPNDDTFAIADLAARLIEEGQNDYLAAKRKAAKQLGFGAHVRLPDNAEIETALRERQATFTPDEHALTLQQQRATALRAMQWLAEFEPWLSGAVLTGSATQTSAIELEIIGADIKQLDYFLLGANVEFDCSLRQPTRRDHARRSGHSERLVYSFDFEDLPVHLTLFATHNDRQAQFPKDSLRHERVQINDARALFSGEPNERT